MYFSFSFCQNLTVSWSQEQRIVSKYPSYHNGENIALLRFTDTGWCYPVTKWCSRHNPVSSIYTKLDQIKYSSRPRIARTTNSNITNVKLLKNDERTGIITSPHTEKTAYQTTNTYCFRWNWFTLAPVIIAHWRIITHPCIIHGFPWFLLMRQFLKNHGVTISRHRIFGIPCPKLGQGTALLLLTPDNLNMS